MRNDDERLAAVILAAGKGTRMYSDKPKVLRTLLGEPMLWYVLKALRSVAHDNVLTVIGHRADLVQALFPDKSFIHQDKQLGTGHALQCAWPEIVGRGTKWCLVVNGDTPLLTAAVLRGFIAAVTAKQSDVGFMTMRLSDPRAYGRVIRDASGQVTDIVEAKDYDAAAHGAPTNEVNAGVYLLKVDTAGALLSQLRADNQQQEFYLTDIIGLARKHGLQVHAAVAEAQDAAVLMGVNTPAELVGSEEELRKQIVANLLDCGVLVHAPDMARIGPRVQIEPGSELFGPCELYGQSLVRAGAIVESHTWIRDSMIGPGCRVRGFSHLEGAVLADQCMVGPFARLRPEAVLESQVRVGNFVEVKKATLRAKAKANHLSYIGDAEVGTEANIGAGTITCNYDGKNKHHTAIGAKAFIGSNTALVAPVRVGANALVGAGSVITKDVPDDTLVIARAKQQCYPKRK